MTTECGIFANISEGLRLLEIQDMTG